MIICLKNWLVLLIGVMLKLFWIYSNIWYDFFSVCNSTSWLFHFFFFLQMGNLARWGGQVLGALGARLRGFQI